MPRPKPAANRATLNQPSNGISQLMRLGRLATVRDFLNDPECLAILRGLPHAEERLQFLREHQTDSSTDLQLTLWSTVKQVLIPSWEPPGGWRIGRRVWQMRACGYCGQKKRTYEGFCRECRQLKLPGSEDRFCSNCKRPLAKRPSLGRCNPCYLFLRRNGQERLCDSDGRAIRPKFNPEGLSCSNCKRPLAKRPLPIRGRCNACHLFLRRHGQERLCDSDGRAIRAKVDPKSPETRAKLSAAFRGRKLTPEHRAKLSAARRRRAPPSQETRAKWSSAARGRKLSPEVRARMSAAQKALVLKNPERITALHSFRKPPSPETRAKISATLKGRTLPPEQVAKAAAAHKGKKRTQETRAKMSAAMKGRPISPEARAKISATLKGRTIPPETRAKISAAHLGRKLSPETRAKLSGAAIRSGRRPPPRNQTP
jgi:hypothetical protein